MGKLPKDFLKKISEAEFFERFDGKKWVRVPVNTKEPAVQRLKEMMIAEIEINVTKEAMDIGLLRREDKDWD
jgi:hypothetical protein